MSDHKVFYIQLTRVTQEQLTKFLKLFGELNNVALPSHVENTIIDLLLSKEEELCLEVSHAPVALTICDTDGVQQFAPINEVIKVFEAAVAVKKVFENIKGAAVEPEPSTTTFNSEPKLTFNEQPAVRTAGKKAQTNILTVEEAACEFQEMWQTIATALTNLNLVIPGKSRIEHVQLAMDLLVRYELGGTTH